MKNQRMDDQVILSDSGTKVKHMNFSDFIKDNSDCIMKEKRKENTVKKEPLDFEMTVDQVALCDVGTRNLEFSNFGQDNRDAMKTKIVKAEPLDNERSDNQASFSEVGPLDIEFSVSDIGPREMEFSSCSEDDSNNLKKKIQAQKTVKERGQTLCSITVGTSTNQPSADHSPLLHESGSLPFLNKSHVCQHCSTAFLMFNSLRVHMVTFHGEKLQTGLPMFSIPDAYGGGGGGGDVDHDVKRVVKIKEEGNNGDEKFDKLMCYHSDEREVKYVKEKGNYIGEKSDEKVDDPFEERGMRIKKEGSDDSNNPEKKVTYHEGKNIRELGNHGQGKVVGTRKDRVDGSNMVQKDVKRIRRHICDVCGKAFTHTGDFKRHLLIHTGHKPFVCDVCTKAFTLSGNLNAHKLIHTGHKQYVCDVCGKAFAKSSSFNVHKLTHTGHKPFVCFVCSKAFSEAGSLKKHQLIHIGLSWLVI